MVERINFGNERKKLTFKTREEREREGADRQTEGREEGRRNFNNERKKLTLKN